MGNYLTIISRSDFSDLYKFGYLFVHNMVPFDGNLSAHTDDKDLFKAVTAYINTYEYFTEYLLLHIRRTVFAGSSVELFVRDIVGVYALNSEAKNSLAVSLDSRIKIQISAWASFFTELNKRQAIRQSKAGMFNCLEIFQITEEERDAVNSLITNALIEEIYSDLYKHERPSGERSIWNYLIRYERHSPYWNDNRGFFSDAIHVYESHKRGQEIDYEIVDEVPAGEVISQRGTNFNELYQALTHFQQSDYRLDGCNYFAVAPLYLYLKACFRDGGITPTNYNATQYKPLHGQFGVDFALAVALLGVSLGHVLTYSCYYQIMNLGIFNSKTETNTKIVHPASGQELSIDEAQNLINSLHEQVKNLQSENVIPAEKKYPPQTVADIKNVEYETVEQGAISFPITMRKLKKSGDGFCKGKPKVAQDKTEYDRFISQGFVPEDYHKKNKKDLFNWED